MSARERKAALVLRGITGAHLARELEVSEQQVSQVLRGFRRSPRVEAAIAAAIGKPVGRVFPAVERRVA